MYTKLLSVIAIIEIMWGTIFSVLCVLKMTLKDIARSSSLGGIGDGWKTMKENNGVSDSRYKSRFFKKLAAWMGKHGIVCIFLRENISNI